MGDAMVERQADHDRMIALVREYLGYSQAKLGREVGMTDVAVCRVETGGIIGPGPRLKILRFLGSKLAVLSLEHVKARCEQMKLDSALTTLRNSLVDPTNGTTNGRRNRKAVDKAKA